MNLENWNPNLIIIYFQQEKHKIEFLEVNLEDAGEIKCVVKNKLGEKSQSGILSVTRKKKKKQNKKNIKINF